MEIEKPLGLSSRLEIISLQLEKDKLALSKEEKKHTDELVKSIKALTKRLADVEKSNKTSPISKWFADKKSDLKRFTSLGGLTEFAAQRAGPGLMGAVLSTAAQRMEKTAEEKDKRFGFVSSVLKGTNIGRDLESKVGTKEAVKRVQAIYQERTKAEAELAKLNDKRKELKDNGKAVGLSNVDLTKEELEKIDALQSTIEKLNDAVTGFKRVEPSKKDLPKDMETAKREYKKSVIKGIRQEHSDLPLDERKQLEKQNPNHVRDLENAFLKDIDTLNEEQLRALLDIEQSLNKPETTIPEKLTSEEEATKKEFIEGVIEGIREGMQTLSSDEKAALAKEDPEFLKGIEDGVFKDLNSLSKAQLEELIKISASLGGDPAEKKESELEAAQKKKTLEAGKNSPEKKEGVFSSLLTKGLNLLKTGIGSIGSLFKGLSSSILPMLGKALPFAAAGLALAGGNAIDSVASNFDVGGKEIDTKQDDSNWEKMSTLEKIQSGAARGIEKVGGFIGLDNMANEAKSQRIASETAYLEKTAEPLAAEVPKSRREFIFDGITETEEKKAPTPSTNVVNAPTVVNNNSTSNTVNNARPKLRNDDISYVNNLNTNFRY